jgi:hypothetical protein
MAFAKIARCEVVGLVLGGKRLPCSGVEQGSLNLVPATANSEAKLATHVPEDAQFTTQNFQLQFCHIDS